KSKNRGQTTFFAHRNRLKIRNCPARKGLSVPDFPIFLERRLRLEAPLPYGPISESVGHLKIKAFEWLLIFGRAPSAPLTQPQRRRFDYHGYSMPSSRLLPTVVIV